MDKMPILEKKAPVRIFSLTLLFLMLIVTVFLILIQNIDQFSGYFGGTAFKIVFDAALVILFLLLAVFIFYRSYAYNRELKIMVGRLQESNMLLRVLNSIQSSANATPDSERLFEESLEALMTLNSSRGIIYVIDEETSHLKPQSARGEGINPQNLPEFAVGEGVVGWVAENGQPLANERAATTRKDSRGLKGMTSPGYIALPINAGNKVMGVLFVESDKGPYSSEEKTLLSSISEVIGNSLTNSKLYDITRRALDNSRKTQGYLESFIMEAKIGVLVIDDGGMVLIANHEAENYLHIQYKDIMGKNAFDILGASQWRGQRLAQAFTSCLADKSSLQYSHPLEDDPASLAADINVFPLFKEKEELIGAAATFRKT